MLLLFFATAVTAHLTFTNAGQAAAGQRVLYELNVPHSTGDAFVTAAVEVNIPRGVLEAKPRNKPGWNTTVVERLLAPSEQYMTEHGLVTTAVAQITFSAFTPQEAIQNDEVEVFPITIRFGCNMSDPASNTLWQSNYAMWFPVRQFIAPAGSLQTSSIVEWTGTRQGNEVWALATPSPSPYLLLSNWSSCPVFTFLGATVPQVWVQSNSLIRSALQIQLTSFLRRWLRPRPRTMCWRRTFRPSSTRGSTRSIRGAAPICARRWTR
jgi:uncharacterized protein YcnI